jgi:hypothetical protein
MPQVPCDKLSELPDLILDFAGHEIVLKAEDYVVKSYWPFCDRDPITEYSSTQVKVLFSHSRQRAYMSTFRTPRPS